MSAKCFVDTNILVYSRDSSEPEKQEKAAKWLAHLWQHEQRIGELTIVNPFRVGYDEPGRLLSG